MAPRAARSFERTQSVACDGAIFVLGGASDQSRSEHDVWRSTDGGAQWSLVSNAPGWSGRWQARNETL
jgi:hypothetical protein